MQSEYFAFITAAYGISAVAIAGLFAWILLDARTQRRALKTLEARGIRRRSEVGGRAGQDTEAAK
ncbi:heme exporter protein CcmD [Jiella sp. MQZ9-1]|uniref:Heme exporter protein D n=1 Tax=Jiella flava TaxID=2816857 RepID=A0A939JUV9_9HYPH|nr:heme exporter protein CcmD [Jiella flava]MBO0663560.1 heme exporter protein CcmD [Jiella flava]MCD2472135.1 heme exporter protein CcmD [Jiella flava]